MSRLERRNLKYMVDENGNIKIPHELLSDIGREGGKVSAQHKSKEYFSELGRRSAAKRKQDKRFTKEYYADLARKSAAKRKENYKARKKAEKAAAPQEPVQQPEEVKKSPLRTINRFLKGKF